MGTSKNHGGGQGSHNKPIEAAVHLGHMLRALMTKKNATAL